MDNEEVKNIATSSIDYAVEEKQPPIRSVICLKNRKRIREFEKVEDCFILNYNPYYKPLNLSSISKCLKQDNHDSKSNIAVLAEHGKVACRDFPHSRHQCVEYPFSKIPHENCCKLCYCYVCDIAAPCTKWLFHCHATHIHGWRYLRRLRRGQYSESDTESEYGPASPETYDEESDEPSLSA